MENAVSNPVLEAIKDFHDISVRKVIDGNGPEISNFSGIKISSSGLGFEEYARVASNIATFQKERSESKISFPGKAIILEKNFAINLFWKLDHYVFRKINDKGETTGRQLEEIGEIRDKHDIIGTMILAYILCLFAFCFSVIAPFMLHWGFVFGIPLSIAGFIGINKLENRSEKKSKRAVEDFLMNTSRRNLLKQLFPVGRDGDGNTPVKINFPDPEHIADTLQETLKYCAQIPKSRPIVIAYEKAIGLELNAKKILESFKADPFIALETEKYIVIFPDTRWGEISEEKELMDKLQNIFSTEGCKLFN
ncbi:MAG: hypothetical protein US50_C0019G0016 [Candidatus Nomurabacteria bacterium GW2011_GWB1_37_5]|uniref:Uncharacterized protein n=1 Tax=Candidatus Nomurabacteria bacterium GW2011_GWB1_37_5 TaxID=1618742 RepID=A0A0G0JEU6_9BACT|nr:MAG: hypothetical protein US50_C0019G0016 [Candidatus Nomurabacteria bacterium GW2011_GWB1_37_5]